MTDANSKKDWSRAEQYYYQAVDVFPEGEGSCCPQEQPVLSQIVLTFQHIQYQLEHSLLVF